MTPVMQTNSCGNVLLFFVSCVLSHNFIFSRFLGCCPFLGVSNKVETAAGMGLAVTFVMGLASLFTSAVYRGPRPVRGDVPEEVQPCAVQIPGHLPPADNHQLRGAGRRYPEHQRAV